MKKTISIIRFIFWRRSVLAAAVLSVCAGGVFLWQSYTLSAFVDSYHTYESLAETQQNIAFIPGAANNPLRAELNQTLQQVLTPNINTKQRLAYAHHGLDLIIQSNAEVDAIAVAAPDVSRASDEMDSIANEAGNILRRSAMLSISALAKQELYTIEDIRGLSYRANFQTAEVFNRVIKDNGTLTTTYMKDLNSQLPDAEKSFNDRQNSYTELQKQIYDIQQKFASLGGSS